MDGTTNFLLTQGVLGVITLVLSTVVIKLYSKTEALQKQINDLQEARRLDAKEMAGQITSVLPGISQSLQNLGDKIEISKRIKE